MYVYIDIDRYRYDTMCIYMYIYIHVYIYIYTCIYIYIYIIQKLYLGSLTGSQASREANNCASNFAWETPRGAEGIEARVCSIWSSHPP